MKKLQLISVKKATDGKKKYVAIFEKDGKKITRKFGSEGMSDFTKHKDKERRERYISRHKKDLKTGDPTKPGYLSMFILWNKPSFSASVKDYKRRLNIYNRTGNFPIKIAGSKNLKFGGPYRGLYRGPFSKSLDYSLSNFPEDVRRLIRNFYFKSRYEEIIDYLKVILHYKFETFLRNHNSLKDPLKASSIKTLIWLLIVNYSFSRDLLNDERVRVIEKVGDFIAWLEEQSDIDEAMRIDPEVSTKCMNVATELINKILKECTPLIPGMPVDPPVLNNFWEIYNIDMENYVNKIFQMDNEPALQLLQQGFGKSKLPDNVMNKALYQRIKTKIRKEVDKKGRRWGAYDSGRLVREYKQKGGKYSGKKSETSDLSRWYKEKWIDACAWPKKKSCGRTKSKEKIAYCRPSVRVDAKTPKLIQELSDKQIKSRCAKKKNNPKKKIS